MTKPSRSSELMWLVGALVGISFLIPVLHGVTSLRRVNELAATEEVYTYNGNSIPLIHPVQFELPNQPVALTLQESVHYAWNDPSNVTRDEYVTMLKYQSRSFLGPEHRQTITSWYHNLHCIAQLRAALFNHNDKVSTVHHFGHCLQYLRQFLLCGATDTIEEGDFMTKDFTVDRVGSDLVCQDWEYAFSVLRHEEDEFKRWYRDGQV